ncbi:MAG: hypothetical protein M1826_002546 [Phylliscum demangeonii]|nr:MAG: hypothetical protein M1826_002546 [Phylliscum demangeonii]
MTVLWPASSPPLPPPRPLRARRRPACNEPRPPHLADRPKPTLNSFTAAMACYPIVSQIARSLDLNDLHHLALTCRQVRANLRPYRRALVRCTLRCDYDMTVQEFLRDRCARDQVGACRRCGCVCCRNCILKPPPARSLAGRHRRLCPTCLAAPLSAHTLPVSSTSGPASPSPASGHSALPRPAPDATDRRSFTNPAFEREPCACAEIVWLCRRCAKSIQLSDTINQRVWTWRSKYSHYMGLSRVSPSIGDYLEGVKCGREEACLASREVEVEVVCEGPRGPAGPGHGSFGTGAGAEGAKPADGKKKANDADGDGAVDAEAGTGHTLDGADKHDAETGYLRQEIEGIGGVVKRKTKTTRGVGAVVHEWEDELQKGDFLGREIRGQERRRP